MKVCSGDCSVNYNPDYDPHTHFLAYFSAARFGVGEEKSSCCEEEALDTRMFEVVWALSCEVDLQTGRCDPDPHVQHIAWKEKVSQQTQ